MEARDAFADGRYGPVDPFEEELASEQRGYTATRHQREVGTGYFDEVAQVIAGGTASTLALAESTEKAQF